MTRRSWLVAFLLAAGCGGQPQLGGGDEAFGAVDALFTAVTSRRPPLLDDSERQLKRLRDAGKLPAAAAERLDAIISEARAGRWEASARSLTDFIRAQRRE